MENNVIEIIKNAVIEYVKGRNEDVGKVMDIFNHIKTFELIDREYEKIAALSKLSEINN